MRRILFNLTMVMVLVLLSGLTLLAGSNTVRKAQQALQSKGFDPGPIDGIIGPKTRAAVRAYQQQNNITPTGRLGGETYQSLGIERESVGGHMKNAGDSIKGSYAKGGKEIGQGGKDLGEDLKDGKVTDAAKDFGKGVGSGAAKIGKGTSKAAKNAAKGVKDAFTPSEKK